MGARRGSGRSRGGRASSTAPADGSHIASTPATSIWSCDRVTPAASVPFRVLVDGAAARRRRTGSTSTKRATERSSSRGSTSWSASRGAIADRTFEITFLDARRRGLRVHVRLRGEHRAQLGRAVATALAATVLADIGVSASRVATEPVHGERAQSRSELALGARWIGGSVRPGALRSLSRCTPRSRTSASTSARVVSERSTWPPWPTAAR